MYRHWDNRTLILYLGIAAITTILLNITSKENNKKYVFFIYFIIYSFLIMFSCFRIVNTNSIVGADAMNYINMFLDSKKVTLNLSNIITLKGAEPLFYNSMYLLRLFTNNYHWFFFYIYSLIIICYLYFYNNNIKNSHIIIITLLFILPFIGSFNTIRNSAAVGIGLIAICKLKENKKKWYLFLAICAILTHYTGIVLILFYLFNLIKNKIDKYDRKPIFIILFTMLSGLLTLRFFTYYLSESKYNIYMNLETSYLGYLPMLILLILCIYFYKDLLILLKRDNNLIHLNIFFFSFACLPFVLKGAARFLLYFDFSRYVIWGYIIIVIKSKIKQFKNNNILEIISFLLIICWIVFRFYRDCYSAGTMPYYNELFHLKNILY